MKICWIFVFCFSIDWFYTQGSLETISQDLLMSVRYNEPYAQFEQQIAEVSFEELTQTLHSENQKKAFWLNVYNAFIQIKAKEHSELISGSRNLFFGTKWIKIAGITLSFDDIEHGILRHSQWKLGKGYITRWFPGKVEKQLRLDTVDFRIHFALNCGAKSCPPVAFYQSKKIDKQLEEATIGFLKTTSVYDHDTKTITISKLFSWFSGDFDGKKGVTALLIKKGLIPKNQKVKIRYTSYDWTIELNQYKIE